MSVYSVLRLAALACFRMLFRLRVDGRERVPAHGAFVVAPVHRSFIDFALVTAITRRRLRFMAKDSLWKLPALGRFLDKMGAFPVRRGTADRTALRRCIEIVEGGEPLVIFPEGTRRSGPVVDNLFEGAAYVATRTNVPVVPVGIGGSERALPKGRRLPRPVPIRLIVGEPVVPSPAARPRPSRRAVHEVTERLGKELQALYDEAEGRAGIVPTDR